MDVLKETFVFLTHLSSAVPSESTHISTRIYFNDVQTARLVMQRAFEKDLSKRNTIDVLSVKNEAFLSGEVRCGI